MFAHPPARKPWRGYRTRGAWLHSSSSQLLHPTFFLTVVISAGVHVAAGRTRFTVASACNRAAPDADRPLSVGQVRGGERRAMVASRHSATKGWTTLC